MSAAKKLFVNSVRTVPIKGNLVTPTAVRYSGSSFDIGHDALENDDPSGVVIDDFKVALGNGTYDQLAKRAVATSESSKRTPVGVAQDFISRALNYLDTWAAQNSLAQTKHVLVAEPLPLEDAAVSDDSWLKNYRSNVKRILHSKEIDFLPEPFAVFQYYRYGVKHPLIQEAKKHVALVLDFGGGTFDVSVIATTAKGDISESGRNQSPLAAKSVAAAGFYINRCVAQSLLFKSSPDLSKNHVLRRALELYSRSVLDDNDPTLSAEVQTFLRNFHQLVQRCESAKISICSSIHQWDLAANLSARVPVRVRVPARPFAEKTELVEITFDAEELKGIFEKEVWARKLLPAIQDVLRRASEELRERPVSVILLSGGSSNIGWLKKLIERDLLASLRNAQIVSLAENYQDIVAKGLAIECARRYYTEGEGDFQAVLYNKLCLLLSPNGRGIELQRFKASHPADLSDSGEKAVLLPSASSLRARFNQELRWKVKLPSTPSQSLEYYYMRSSFDPEDTHGRLNFVQTSVPSPRGARFGQEIEAALTVREDGTAVPSFIFGRGRQGEATVTGTPFFLDMTSAAAAQDVDTYIGFDFGSSTSAFSLVSRADVHEYREREQDANWLEVSELVAILPYPVSSQVARYLSETTAESTFKRGRAAIEAALCFLAYSAYADYRENKGRGTTALFKGLAHRSAGPLWGFLQSCVQGLGARSQDRAIAQLLAEPTRGLINEAVNAIAKEKHDQAVSVDLTRVLRILGNAIVAEMQNSVIGYFEEVTQRPFTSHYEGVFRCLRGPSEPFVELYNYRGNHTFARNLVFKVDLNYNKALDMTPLYVWGLNSIIGDVRSPDLYMFDNAKRTEFGFIAVQERAPVVVDQSSPLSELWQMVETARSSDQLAQVFSDVKLQRRSLS